MAKTIGKYEIIRSLGSGAMGEVYLAHQSAIGREVAIKTILSSVAKGEDAEGRFRREAEAAGKLSHPNLVTIFDFDKDGDILYLVMEYVKGDDLEDLIRKQELSQSQFLEVLAQVCDGLSHAHRNGIIHRDVKPANVRVVRDGRNLQAKVMDFGIARVDNSNLTATGIVMGTVSYMAPEYIRGGHASTQSDLFAVGVMLYECLTGRKPFAGDNTTTILFKIVSETAPPIDLNIIYGISPAIREVLDKALSKEPAARYQSADDLARALRACKDPSWAYSVEEATSMIQRHQQALAMPPVPRPADPDGTQLVPTAAPTVMERAPEAQATALMPAVPAAPVKGAGNRVGLYGSLAAVALLAVGGGAYLALRPKAPAVPAVQTPEAASPAGQVTPPPVTPAQAPPGEHPARTEPKAEPDKQAPSKVEPPKPAPAQDEPAKPAPAQQVEPPKPPAPKVEPPKPVDINAKSITSLLESDPRQAGAQAKTLLAADPSNVELNGLYLAAMYRAKSPWDFERGLSKAMASSVTIKKMLSACPAFKAALAEEVRLRRAKPPAGLLTDEAMNKITAGL